MDSKSELSVQQITEYLASLNLELSRHELNKRIKVILKYLIEFENLFLLGLRLTILNRRSILMATKH